jgi:hypothetical protein
LLSVVLVGIGVMLLFQLYLAWRIAVVVENQMAIAQGVGWVMRVLNTQMLAMGLYDLADAPPPAPPKLSVVKPKPEGQ